MTNTQLTLRGFLQALFAIVYIILVALIMTHAESLFGPQDSLLSFTVFVLLVVFSVALMGVVVFGKPILLYLDGQKREGVLLALHTIAYLGCLLVIGIIVLSL